jgi:valyl-tRNA synthetase
MPFITEEIWQKVRPLAGIEGETIMLQPYPEYDEAQVNSQALQDIEWVKGVVVALRNIRGEMNIPPSKQLPVLLKNGDKLDRERLQSNSQFLCKLAQLESIRFLESSEKEALSATALVGDLEILVAMAGLIDKDAELARLDRESEKLEKDIARLKGKLSNANFVDRAPAEVVEKEKERLAEAEQAFGKISAQKQQIAEL